MTQKENFTPRLKSLLRVLIEHKKMIEPELKSIRETIKNILKKTNPKKFRKAVDGSLESCARTY